MELVIGLEIHLELATKSKMFCGCSADHFGKAANSQTCPVCLGLPGALPFPNRQAIEWTLLLGMALGCEIPFKAKFDRKNYFYPDLPKGYQISQYDQPFCQDGLIKIRIGQGTKQIRIRRVHLEEDTGKLIHLMIDGRKYSLIDFNRSGVPLVEVVTEPDIHSVDELGIFTKNLQQIVRYLSISKADMEKGQMRLELNISLRREGENELPTYRVEVKNINSFRFLEKAAIYEIKRQSEILGSGQTPPQQTRGYDQLTGKTKPQREKEEAHDYRYFPEPDIPPFNWVRSEIEALRKKLPELPDQKEERFVKDYKLTVAQAAELTKNFTRADYFEQAVALGRKEGISAQDLAKVIINKKVDLQKASPAWLVKKMVQKGRKKELGQEEVEKLAEIVLRENQEEVKKYQNGKVGLLQFFVGQVMRLSKGQANPELLTKILIKKLQN